MTKYLCPICSKRACDSEKSLSLAKLNSSNEAQADVIIKCRCCKNTLAVKVTQDFFVIDNINLPQITNQNNA